MPTQILMPQEARASGATDLYGIPELYVGDNPSGCADSYDSADLYSYPVPDGSTGSCGSAGPCGSELGGTSTDSSSSSSDAGQAAAAALVEQCLATGNGLMAVAAVFSELGVIDNDMLGTETEQFQADAQVAQKYSAEAADWQNIENTLSTWSSSSSDNPTDPTIQDLLDDPNSGVTQKEVDGWAEELGESPDTLTTQTLSVVTQNQGNASNSANTYSATQSNDQTQVQLMTTNYTNALNTQSSMISDYNKLQQGVIQNL